MATFTATLSMAGFSYSKSATLDDSAVMAIINSLIRRQGKTQDANADGSPMIDEAGHPVLRDNTPTEAVSASLGAWLTGLGQNALDDAQAAAATAAKSAVPALPDFQVL